jgi:50S ribosomal subunit-associated GTPase HflX
VQLSARTGEGRETLFAAIRDALALEPCRMELEFDAASDEDRATIARLYREGRVLAHDLADGRVRVTVELARRLLPRFPLSSPPACGGSVA